MYNIVCMYKYIEMFCRTVQNAEASQTETSIALLWNKPKDYIKVEEYHIYINKELHGCYRCTDYTANNLAPNREYEVAVHMKLKDDNLTLKSSTIKVWTKEIQKVYDITEYGAILPKYER